MSKMDNLRAMREAKYAETVKRTAAAAKTSGSKPPRAAPKTDPQAEPAQARGSALAGVEDTAGAAEPALCGHRNMGGRSCTREHGHAAKSHRYS